MQLDNTTMRSNQTWYVALVCVFALFFIFGLAQVSSGNDFQFEINKGTFYLEDHRSSLNIDDVRDLPRENWEKESSEKLSFGMNTNPFWFESVIFPHSTRKPRLLEIDYAVLDKVDVWFYQNKTLLAEFHEGDSYPFEARTIKSEKLLFPIPKSTYAVRLIVRIQTEGTVKLPMRVWEESEYLIFNGKHNLIIGLFFGFMLAMILSNLFFYVTTGSAAFLTYSLYVVSMALTLATLHGLAFKYLWPDWVWLQSRGIGIFATLTILFATYFSKQLLNVKEHSPALNKYLIIALAIHCLAVLLSFVLPYYIYINILLVILCLSAVLVFVTAVYLWVKGVKLARFYLLAWSALPLTGFLAGFEAANIVELNIPSHYLWMLGATIETFMLAFALALSYGTQRDEQFKTQELALVQERLARESQEQALKVREEAQEDLEYKVQERTLELEIALRELSETNNELEQQTLTDSLTGIRNRKHFDKKYQAEVRRCRREKTDLSVVMLDIDNFKTINDTHGHVVGDQVIIEVAKMLQHNLKRTTDDACRYGGEEFALILPNTDLEGAMKVAETVRKDVEELIIETDGLLLKVTISAGVSTTVVTAVNDEKNLLESADKSLYRAKRNGRNRVEGSCLHARDIL